MTILYIIIAILMFGLLIAVHEFGHFVTAKLCGVRVNEFAIGMGPALWKRQKGETLYSLRAFPVGGFCAMEGEDEDTGDSRAFTVQPAWKKLVILAAGAFMNLVIGVIFLVIVILPSEGFFTNEVSALLDGFPNQPGQVLQAGDRITKVDGHRVLLYSDISLFVSRSGSTVDLVIERSGETIALPGYPVTAVQQADGSTRPMLGIIMGGVERATPGVKLKYVCLQAADDVRLVWYSLTELLRGAVGLRDLSGPVGIITMVGEVGEQGAEAAKEQELPAWYGALMNILEFSSFIAINLAVMNLLPIPALDGGRIFFLIVNSIVYLVARRKISPRYEGYVHAAGMVLLLGLTVVVALSDVWKLIS